MRLSSAWLFHRKYELATVNKAINLESQYENKANSTSVLRLTLTLAAFTRMRLPLITSGLLLVALVIWMSWFGMFSMPDSPGTRDGVGGYPPIFLVTFGLSVSALVSLVPVFRKGSGQQRYMAAVIAAFPFLISVTVIWRVLHFTL